jgi:hypothetical protein
MLGLRALNNRTAVINNERKDERVLPVIDPPKNNKYIINTNSTLIIRIEGVKVNKQIVT